MSRVNSVEKIARGVKEKGENMLKRNATILWRELGGEAVLLDPTIGCSYTLNAVGTLIWKSLDGQQTPESIAQLICNSYDVDYEQAVQDVEAIIGDLQHNNLLYVQQASPYPDPIAQ